MKQGDSFMYKFEISADTPKELQERMLEFAREHVMTDKASDISSYETEDDEMGPSISEQSVPTMNQPFNSLQNSEPLPTPKLTTTSPQPQPEGTLDRRGLPWDARIHSANKTFDRNGEWRTRRGVENAVLVQIENELITKIRNAQAAQFNTAPQAPMFVQPPPPPVVITPTTFIPPPVEPVVHPKAYENIPMPQSFERPAHTMGSFKISLNEILARLINEGKIDQAYIAQLCEYFKIKNIWNVTGSEKMTEELFIMFAKLGFITSIQG